MKRSMWFFCQMLIAGGALSHTLSLTSDEAQQHLQDLKQKQETKRAYAIEIGVL